MNYQFDFGTGAGRTHPHPLTWMEWVYPYPGTFIVTGIADSRYVSAFFKTYFTVKMKTVKKETFLKAFTFFHLKNCVFF